MIKKYFKFLALLVLVLVGVELSFADLKLNHIQFDPSVIAAGDEVDIIIQFENQDTFIDESKIGNRDYTFKVFIRADDDLTQKYITFVDSYGDDLHGTVYSSQKYNKVFRVKVNQDAIAANYQFELVGQWYKNGVAQDYERSLKFVMPVKKEGIILSVASINTVPSQIRPGDKFVEIKTFIENVGEKDAKNVEIKIGLPEGIVSSYSNDNRLVIGRLNAGESREVSFFYNLDENLSSSSYDINYEFNYFDLDNNEYSKVRTAPLLVKPRSYLEIEKVEGTIKAGDSAKLYVWVKNTGEQSAESVDVRLLKQSSQPFSIDVRSDYIGELEAGESGLAVFDIKANSDAEIKTHDFKLIIRSKGDSDEGDETIYTYNRRASIDVVGKAPNKLLYAGLFGLVLLIGFLVVSKFRSGGKKRK